MSSIGLISTTVLASAALLGSFAVYEYTLADISSATEKNLQKGLKVEDKIERGTQLFLKVYGREPSSHNELVATGFLPSYANKITQRNTIDESIAEKYQRAVNDWSKDPNVGAAEVTAFINGSSYSSLPSSVQNKITEKEYDTIKSLDTQLSMAYNKLSYDSSSTTEAVRGRADKFRTSSSLRYRDTDDKITGSSKVENLSKIESTRKDMIYKGIKNAAMEGNVEMANHISSLAKKAYGEQKAKEIITAGMVSAITEKTTLLSNLNTVSLPTSSATGTQITEEALDTRISTIKNTFMQNNLITQ